MKQIIRTTSLVAVAIIMAVIGVGPVTVQAAGNAEHCQQYDTDVTLSASDPTVYQVYGELCWNGQLGGKTVQLLVAGGTYDHTYWDFPYQSATYSYVQAATDQGYATFAVDRIGTGLSSKPSADKVVVATHVYVQHQLVQNLRAGDYGSEAFGKVIAVGHSFGSGVSILEAAQYHDVDGVIVTGLLHAFNPIAVAGFATLMHLAQLDPKFAGAGLPLGYTTTVPGQRTGFFFNTANADANVIALDEQLKTTSTAGELLTLFSITDASQSRKVNVPVLVVVGQKDHGMCNELLSLSCANQAAVLAREQSAYSAAAQLEVYVQQNAGHCVNLHYNANDSYQTMLTWAAGHNLL
jgi:pimeloyl-ACP methyl ester carboxylesterase